MRTPTANDIKPKELQNFLESYGFRLKRVKGDHFIYDCPNSKISFILTIPMANPVKQAYIDQVRERILEIEGE